MKNSLNTTPYPLPGPAEPLVTTDANTDFVSKFQDLVTDLHAKLNEGRAEPTNIVGLSVCAVQLDGQSSCVLRDQAEKPENPALRLAAALLATSLQEEEDNRVALLLSKAQKLTEQALRIKTGEILSSTLH
jgi:hypothetical protein